MIHTPTELRVQGIHLEGGIPFQAIALTLSVAIALAIFGWGRHQLGPFSRTALGASAIGLAIYGGTGALTVLNT